MARSGLVESPLLGRLPDDLRAELEGAFRTACLPFGETILTGDDAPGTLCVLVRGRARVVLAADGEESSLAIVTPGDVFGPEQLTRSGGGSLSVRASTDVEVMCADATTMEALCRERPELRARLAGETRLRRVQAFLREHTAFGKLPASALVALARDLTTMDIEAGTVLVREGDPPGPMLIIEEGRCRAFASSVGGTRGTVWLRPGDHVGGLALLRGNSPHTVEAASNCRLLCVPGETVRALLGGHGAFRRAIEAGAPPSDRERRVRIPLDFAPLLPTAAAPNGNGNAHGNGHVGANRGPGAPFAEEAGRFAGGPRRMRRFPHVWQIDEMDCASACLAIVARHYGRSISPARIRALLHIGLDGASLAAICRCGEELGLAARPVKASAGNLDHMPLPAIVHWRGNHWVVLYDVAPGYVRVSDPATGKQRIERTEFEQQWTGFAALFEYVPAFSQQPGRRVGVRWLASFFLPWRGLLARAVLLALLAAGLQMVLPVFTQLIVDRVLVQRDVALLDLLGIGMVGAVAFTLAATLLQRYLLGFVAVRIDSHTLDFLTRRLLSLPMRYFNGRRTGDIQRRLAGMWQIREFLVEHGVAAITNVTQLGAALTLMLLYSPRLTLVFLALAPVHVLLVRLASAWLYPLYSRLEEAYATYQSFQIDAIKGIETVKSLAGEQAFRGMMLNEFNTVARRRFRADFLVMGYHALSHSVTLLSVVLFFAVGARLVLDGSLSIGGLVAFNVLVALANAPILALLRMWDSAQVATVYLDRLEDVLVHEPEQGEDRARLLPVPTLEGRIAVRGVGFHYEGREASPVLADVTFEALPGTRIAIVGRSGSGKTTLVKCLAGLLEPTVGTILYDGLDLRTLNHRELRRHIGIVLQESHLFDDTIARNVAFGEEEPDLDAVRAAIELADARGFVERLPLGYDTRVGETGLLLSAGQRQRIAIARALYHRPAVLVFDEATAALDTESERVLQENMERLLAGRTAFIIAHRLSTVRDADTILVLDDGRIVERGTHGELMDRQGLYHHLSTRQIVL